MKPSAAVADSGVARLGKHLILSPDGDLLQDVPTPGGAPLVVDSWLVQDGRVRALELHERRFTDACTRIVGGLDRETVDGFLGEVRLALPRQGRWFPRIEAHPGQPPRLVLWLRKAPAPRRSTSLWLAPGPDPRTHPEVKGPDLAVLAKLGERAQLAGAEDAVLRAADGTILEAAHAAIVWWQDDTLCLPPAECGVLASVTATVLVDLAHRSGVAVARERRPAGELGKLEAWTLNALHGIRPVSAWRGVGAPAWAPATGERAQRWSAALEQLTVAIDDVP